MSIKERRALQKFYEKANRLDQLPWHREEAPSMLQKVVGQRTRQGRALDIGCGTGTNAIYLARQGYDVLAVDWLEKPARITRERAAQAGVQVEVVEADILELSTTNRFDLVLDAGCLHGLVVAQERERYRARLMEWFSDDGDYVLTHFLKRHLLDWRPFGPLRVPREKMVGFFSPELEERDYHSQEQKVPLPIGPVLLEGSYWFRRRNG